MPNNRGSITRKSSKFSSSPVFRLYSGVTQPPFQSVPGPHSSTVELPEHETNIPSSVESKNSFSNISTSPYVVTVRCSETSHPFYNDRIFFYVPDRCLTTFPWKEEYWNVYKGRWRYAKQTRMWLLFICCSALVSDIGSIFNLAAIVVGGSSQFKALVSLKPSERQSASIFFNPFTSPTAFPHPQLLLKGVKYNETSWSCCKRKDERLVTYTVQRDPWKGCCYLSSIILIYVLLGHLVVNHVTL